MNEVRVTLDLSKEPASIPPVRIGENDRAAPVLTDDVTDHGQPVSLSGFTAALKMRLPDGAHAFAGTASGSSATFELTGMEPGEGTAYVQITKGAAKLSTQRIGVIVLGKAE